MRQIKKILKCSIRYKMNKALLKLLNQLPETKKKCVSYSKALDLQLFLVNLQT